MLNLTNEREAELAQQLLGTNMSDFKPTLTEEDRAYARALYLALKPFFRLRPTMPDSTS
jgi:hypothetical protein